MPSDRLFSAWRLSHPPGVGSDGLPHASLSPVEGKTLFETIEQSDLGDDRTYVIARTENCFALLNVFPYTSGHLMVLPKRAVPSISDLSDEVSTELWMMVRDAAAAARKAFSPDGLNIGINEGEAGGGSQPEHLHVHVVPRWNADTNFMSTAAETRILPVSLTDSWQLLRDAWPVPLSTDGAEASVAQPTMAGDGTVEADV